VLIVEKIKSGEIRRAVDVRDELPVICSASPKLLKKLRPAYWPSKTRSKPAMEGGGDSAHLKRLTAFRKMDRE